MTTQITVRLPTELVEFVDKAVREGRESGRAAMVVRALEAERRRALALADIEILRTDGGADDLDALAEHAAAVTMDDLD